MVFIFNPLVHQSDHLPTQPGMYQMAKYIKTLLNKIDLNEALFGVSNLGFVPTMGSLHQGHISLIKNSKKQCKKTIVSIFVNPTQFNNKKDYTKYPKNTNFMYNSVPKLIDAVKISFLQGIQLHWLFQVHVDVC